MSRANIQIASLPTAAIGVILAAQNWKDIADISVLLYVLLFFLILTYACNINCISDVEVDQKFKRYMSEAVRAFKPKTLKRVIFVEIILILLLASLLCIIKQDVIFSVSLFGLLCGYAYSTPPLRIKKRGVFSPFPVMIGLYFFPLVFGWFIVAEDISIFILLFALGYALIMQGITFLNTCEDFTEDKSSDITTLAHILGLNKILKLASLAVASGGILVMATLSLNRWERLFNNPVLLPIIAVGLLFLAGTLIYISRTLYILSQSDQAELECKKHSGKMRRWFLSIRYPLFVIALLLVP